MSGEVTTMAELNAMDDDAIVAGYLAGLRLSGDFTRTDKAYWHGYMNGLVDGRHVATPSAAQMELARAYVEAK
jgi:hypothetical protein